MPTATDLVTDLPADFEVFGQAVDTALMDLKGGTTGQVLKKNSNTDMDFVWSGDTGFTNPMTTTGDTIYSSSGSTPARLGIGTTGQVLTVSGGIPAWATPAGGGKVLQVVYGSTSSTVTTTSSTYADTNLSASITPSSATSKVLVLVAQNGGGKFSADTSLSLKLVRGATDLIEFAASAGNTDNSNSNYWGSISANYLDTPATTSATTYKTQYKNNSGTGSVRLQGSNASSQIILMEIGA